MKTSPSRRAFLAGTGGLFTATFTGAAGTARLPERPNFVIILADDLGWGELGCYGQKKIKTPNLDRLAADGVRFTAAYAGAPVCAPSRAALLTGLHTGHSTVRENPGGEPQRPLTERDLTFAELLQMAGYRTACIGKWGFGPDLAGQPSFPRKRGFDEFFGYISHRHAHEYFPDYLWDNDRKVRFGGQFYAPDLFLERARRFIRSSATRDEPFLLYFPTNLPHAPSQVPGGAGRYRGKSWTMANRKHAAQVTLLDRYVGAIVRTLREAGVAHNTILLFSGDNGPHREKGVTPALFNSNGPFRGKKRSLYEGGIRVPLIAWSPSLPRAGRVEHEPVAFWDVLPTLADLAGVPVPANLDGRSFRGLLSGSGFTGHDYLFWNRPRKTQAVRRGRWKAIRFAPGAAGAGPEGRLELYDLEGDAGERQNLADAVPDLAAELEALMDASIGEDPRVPYGLRIRTQRHAPRGVPHEVIVTLHNGSTERWRNVRLRLQAPPGWRVTGGTHLAMLEPGESLPIVFTVTPPKDGTAPVVKTITARAIFSANGRLVRLRRRRNLIAVTGVPA